MISNYRTISLTTVVEKSCLTNLLSFTRKSTKLLTQTIALISSILILVKHFTKYLKLLSKLIAYDIQGKVLQWIKVRLNDKMQRVQVKWG